MPVSAPRMILTHNLLAALDDALNDPIDAGKKIAFDDALEALLASERSEDDTRTAAAIDAYDVQRRRGVMKRAAYYLTAIVIIPIALLAGYHFTVGPGAIASRTAALETKTSLLVTTTTQADALQTLHKGELDALTERLDEQQDFMKAIWPDHDRDGDNVVDRVDVCRGTERGEEVLIGSVDGCSINQAAWLCTDLPAVPAADLTFSWDMTNCPSGMLRPGERVTCTFTAKPDRSGLATNDNCQIR